MRVSINHNARGENHVDPPAGEGIIYRERLIIVTGERIMLILSANQALKIWYWSGYRLIIMIGERIMLILSASANQALKMLYW